ncbi:hypothetical protein J1N35_001308 [Gossypium stocksii]|uniref:Uncharacterized protein n=1 Tax=Gossypium stocksii TaxID=47602 RepID=A0A9D4AJH8_9ROSI|nr:hypothetical protein J1N35_001308 [Gossypium stocksii]
MVREAKDQNVPLETCGRARKASRSRDMMLALEGKVVKLEDFMGDVKESLEVVEGHIVELDSGTDELKEHVLHALNANVEEMQVAQFHWG